MLLAQVDDVAPVVRDLPDDSGDADQHPDDQHQDSMSGRLRVVATAAIPSVAAEASRWYVSPSTRVTPGWVTMPVKRPAIVDASQPHHVMGEHLRDDSPQVGSGRDCGGQWPGQLMDDAAGTLDHFLGHVADRMVVAVDDNRHIGPVLTDCRQRVSGPGVTRHGRGVGSQTSSAVTSRRRFNVRSAPTKSAMKALDGCASTLSGLSICSILPARKIATFRPSLPPRRYRG